MKYRKKRITAALVMGLAACLCVPAWSNAAAEEVIEEDPGEGIPMEALDPSEVPGTVEEDSPGEDLIVEDIDLEQESQAEEDETEEKETEAGDLSVDSIEQMEGESEEQTAQLLSIRHVSVHDPSIFEAGDGYFYVVGSHTASARTADLAEWTQLNADYKNPKDAPFYGDLQTVFEEPFRWAGFDDGDCAGGGYAIWAPDLIWNPYYQWEDGSKGAYMLYVCTSSTWRRSCICYLVSKEPTKGYVYGDTIVYSGFTTSGEVDGKSSRNTKWDNDYLNLKELVELGSENGGIDEVSDKWFTGNGGWDNTYGPNAIDPNLFFDADGQKLYMSYGSWSGGIFLLELDPATGKAIYPGVDSVDEVSGNFVDRYFGVHLVGGMHQSGEGPYITYDPETKYYYLYVTYGGLFAEGGYNMRMFRSENPTGPYLDAKGNNAADNAEKGDDFGIKLIGNYAFYNQIGKRAAGHNSQLNRADGSRYLVYHQRFEIKPQLEAHEVRVHQQFLNEDLWPVTAVYEYRGEQPAPYTEEEVAGSYEFINHGTKTDGEMLTTQLVTLEADHTISGDLTGTWEKTDSGRGYDYITVKAGDVTWKGYFFLQHKENAEEEPVMTFTAVGDDNTCIWGSRIDPENHEMVAQMAANAIAQMIPKIPEEDLDLPAELMGCQIAWSSSDESVVSTDGKITVPAEKTKVELTAVITNGDAEVTQTYKVMVRPAD